MFDYRISVIIPVYNAAEHLEFCLDSMVRQSMKPSDFEVLLVDDGSSDASGEICRRYAQRHPIFKYLPKQNGGVSSARNLGIHTAKGKYLVYLDADDELTDNALAAMANFFDKHYDEIDLLTYPIIPMRGERRLTTHYRYRFLKESGVYDLEDPVYCYTAQTTMNICVKNMGEDNNLFDESMSHHEDQKYIAEVLSRKLTIGFISNIEYHYMQYPGSAVSGKSKAYYIFEAAVGLWEGMFARFPERVPRAIQAYYLHDLNWKHAADILLPYHYGKAEFKVATDRLLALISRLDNDVILNHPTADIFNKLMLINLKHSSNLSVRFEDDQIAIMNGDEEVYSAQKPTVVVSRMKVIDGRLIFDCFLKSPIYLVAELPKFYLTVNGVRQEIDTEQSVYSRMHSSLSADFRRIRREFDLDGLQSFSLELESDGHTYTPNYYFQPQCAMHQGKLNKRFIHSGRRVKLTDKGVFKVRRANVFDRLANSLRNLLGYIREDIKIPVYRSLGNTWQKAQRWMYLDRYGVFDNAYTQFVHDFGKQDGIKRYYILNSCDWDRLDSMFTPEMRPYVVRFRSIKHKWLYMNCSKILTSFSNVSNICPFGIRPLRWYSDLAQYELVYLQHGILHASLVDMYAREKCLVDRVVVSSGFEMRNFTQKYGYAHNNLIDAGMPRYDQIAPNPPKQRNRILFSPSWRSNLIGPLVENERQSSPTAFAASAFYREVQALLNSQQLVQMLEKYDLYLDFKNHPIFACYNDMFTVGSDRITVSCGGTKIDDYCLMITDYSSIVFDAVYIGCPIVYFVPDYDQFLAGVSHNYRELDLPLEEGFGPLTLTAEQLLKELKAAAERGFEPAEPYAERMGGFFLHRDNGCCERIYESLTDK